MAAPTRDAGSARYFRPVALLRAVTSFTARLGLGRLRRAEFHISGLVQDAGVTRVGELELALHACQAAAARHARTEDQQVRLAERRTVEVGVEDVPPGQRAGAEAHDRARERLRSVPMRPTRFAVDLLRE